MGQLSRVARGVSGDLSSVPLRCVEAVDQAARNIRAVDGPIVVVRQPGRRPLFVQVTDRLELGRDCDGLLLSDPQVSRRHAALEIADGRLVVTDLGSRNGTFIDGAPLAGSVELRPSLVVHLGATTVELVQPATPSRPFARTTWPVEPGLFSSADDPRRTSIDIVAESALTDPPRPRLEASDQGTVTILFSDIEGSTQHATRVGDIAWYRLLARHNELLRSQLDRYGGYEVKSRGDGFMLTFPSARRAVRFAIATQRALDHEDESTGAPLVRVRMGLHIGEAIADGSGDLFGRHVIVAARIADLASGAEVLVSSLVKEIAAARGDIVFGPPREVVLKGIEGTCIVHPLDWRASTPPV